MASVFNNNSTPGNHGVPLSDNNTNSSNHGVTPSQYDKDWDLGCMIDPSLEEGEEGQADDIVIEQEVIVSELFALVELRASKNLQVQNPIIPYDCEPFDIDALADFCSSGQGLTGAFYGAPHFGVDQSSAD
ncbi:hypothetical protein ACH5RR_032242 [Cinchona calisaya]|uniref:Uncharacterized protein n=1 Tax=Cinchona calisaya TaxID=153742 RepID=A0ABD2YLS6_9GENT